MHNLSIILSASLQEVSFTTFTFEDTGVDIFFWGQILSSEKFFWPEAGHREVKIIIDHSIAAIDEYVTGEGAAAGKVKDG